MKCPSCGWHVRGGARFCPNCGAEMPAEGPRTCPLCRAEVRGQVSFCPSCGAALDADASEAAAEAQGSAPAAPPAQPAEPPQAPAGEKDEAARTCPSCKSELKGRVGICPVCGEDLSGPPAAPRRSRAADGWPFSTPAAGGRPPASKMKPLSPNWPFDEPEPAKKSSGKKARHSVRKVEATGQAGEGKPDEPVRAKEDKPVATAPRPAAATQGPAGEGPEGRSPEAVRAAGPSPAPDRPPEIKPWYVARPMSEARPTAAPRPRPEAGPMPPPRPRPEARLARGPSRPAQPRRSLGLLPWLGLLAGLVLVSILVYGFAVGGLRLPHLGAGAGQSEQATPTTQATEAPTQTPQPTPTSTPEPPTPTPQPLVHVVEPGESLLSIAQKYGIAVQELIAANSITQSDVLRVGQELVIPGVAGPTATPGGAATEAPTAAPTAETPAAPTATQSASEAPTAPPVPQATVTAALEFPAPNLLNPADGAVFGAEDILLNWSSVGLLGDDTWYVVKIWTDDPAQPTPATGWTRTTAWRIPASSRPPADAASRTFHWTVTVMRAVEGQEAVAISPVSETRTFEWK